MQEKANIINKSDIQSAIGMKGPLGRFVAGIAMRAMGLNRVNEVYKKYCMYEGPEFSKHVLDELNITYDLPESDLANLPEGQFITISNHCFGGVDGLLVSTIIGSRKPDYKILTNFILSMIPTLRDTFLPVNPFKNGETNKKSFSGIRMAMEHLENGGCLGLFPAGAVSTYMKKEDRTAVDKGRIIEDWPWPNNMAKLIRNANVPVVPIYFDGCNSWKFHALGRIHPMLRTARLVRELFNKKDSCIRMRIGRPVLPVEFKEFEDLKSFGQYLRSRVFALEAMMPEKDVKVCETKNADIKPIVERGSVEDMLSDIAAIRDRMLFSSAGYECYLADYKDIPHIITELGRLREEAFRSVGEGTDLALDLDDFDKYYKHLFVWDAGKQFIAGAYRLGIGSEMFERFGGRNAFYTSTLIEYGDAADNILPKCIELGRSFVSVDYQKDTMALQMLFKGLLYSTMEFPEAEYFLGPVSISNSYPKFFQSLMVYYFSNFKAYDGPKPFAESVVPFKADFLRVDPKQMLKGKEDSVEKFDRLLGAMSNGEYRLPPLVKRYFKAGAQLICFNVDPLFNFSLDGLILQPLKGYPESELLPLLKSIESEEEKERFLNRFK